MSTVGDDKGLLNYSTSVPVARTLSEIQAMLGRAGARRVAVEYVDGTEAGVSFSLPTVHGERLYTLPVAVDPVHRILQQQDADGLLRSGKVGARSSLAQAQRVAWRVAKDWLEAQLALVRTQMATLDQVMLPYLHVSPTETLYAAWADSEARALPAGSS